MEDLLELAAQVNWGTVAISLALLAVTVVLGLWLPGRVMEEHTRQPAARYVWWVVGGMVLVMIYISAWGYGWFWNSVVENERADPYLREGRGRTSVRQ